MDFKAMGSLSDNPLISLSSVSPPPYGLDDSSLTLLRSQHQSEATHALNKSLNRIVVKGGNQKTEGTAAADFIDASQSEGHNILLGNGGGDRIWVNMNDRAKGQTGNDYLDAHQGNAQNQLYGGSGNDTLLGRKGDRLFGSGGNDVLDARHGGADNVLDGGGADDVLYASLRSDGLIGGKGRDQFWLTTEQLPTAPHRVKDFKPDQDYLGFDSVNGIDQFDDLTFAASGSNTQIQFNNHAIAILKDISPDEIRADHVLINHLPDEERIFATYRKDYFFPNDVYDEDTPEPLTGGRIQIAAIAQASGKVNNVLIEGIDRQVMFQKNPDKPSPFEWVHVWPQKAKAGEPIWVNFHSRQAKWDTIAQASIQVETRNGLAVDGFFPVVQTPAPLSYVTTTDDYSRLLIHVQNTDTTTHRVQHLWVNGENVLAEDSANTLRLNRKLPSNSHVLWEIPLSTPTSPGEAWTVVVDYKNAPSAVGTGRVIPETFPVMAWNNTSERPFPSGDLDNYLKIRAAGIDTIFVNNGTCRGKACDPYELVNTELAELEDFGAFINYDPFVAPNQGFPDFTDTSGIVAVMTGDESDDTIYNGNGIPIPALQARDSWRSWNRYPELPTFNGGKTNKLIGTFAGMADIQGLDFYTAAGAPHITAFGNHPPLRATFDYLRNMRNNHMPLTTWMYTQGLSLIWNREPILGGDPFSVQPDPQEILVQGMMAIAAGAKGLLWFQVNQDEAEKAPERWQAIADMNRMVRSVRPWLREGDVTGAASADAKTLVELIYAPDALIVPIISLDTTEEPTDLGFIWAQSEAEVPHWIFANSSPDVSVQIPSNFNVADVFEVKPGGIAEIDFTLSEQMARFEDVSLSNDMPVRLLVLAANDAVRIQMGAAFNDLKLS